VSDLVLYAFVIAWEKLEVKIMLHWEKIKPGTQNQVGKTLGHKACLREWGTIHI
jgi:hypothetical protein